MIACSIIIIVTFASFIINNVSNSYIIKYLKTKQLLKKNLKKKMLASMSASRSLLIKTQVNIKIDECRLYGWEQRGLTTT